MRAKGLSFRAKNLRESNSAFQVMYLGFYDKVENNYEFLGDAVQKIQVTSSFLWFVLALL